MHHVSLYESVFNCVVVVAYSVSTLSWQFVINSIFELTGMQSVELLACMALVHVIRHVNFMLSQVLTKPAGRGRKQKM